MRRRALRAVAGDEPDDRRRSACSTEIAARSPATLRERTETPSPLTVRRPARPRRLSPTAGAAPLAWADGRSLLPRVDAELCEHGPQMALDRALREKQARPRSAALVWPRATIARTVLSRCESAGGKIWRRPGCGIEIWPVRAARTVGASVCSSSLAQHDALALRRRSSPGPPRRRSNARTTTTATPGARSQTRRMVETRGPGGWTRPRRPARRVPARGAPASAVPIRSHSIPAAASAARRVRLSPSRRSGRPRAERPRPWLRASRRPARLPVLARPIRQDNGRRTGRLLWTASRAANRGRRPSAGLRTAARTGGPHACKKGDGVLPFVCHGGRGRSSDARPDRAELRSLR